MSDTDDNKPSSDFAALIHAIKIEGAAYRREEKREDRGKKFREWVTIILIALTFVAVCYQVHEMIKVYEPIKKQAEASAKQATASEKAAEATTRAADAATRQSENSDKAFVEAQRAWVGPRNAKSDPPQLSTELNVSVEYQNSGREPAIETTFDSDIFTADEETSQLLEATARIQKFVGDCKIKWTPSQATVVFPSTGGFNGGYELSKALSPEQVDQSVLDGKRFIFFSGCFVYKTAGGIHRSTFCYFFRGGKTKPSNWNICAVGNDAD